jgi:hypothetical protein
MLPPRKKVNVEFQYIINKIKQKNRKLSKLSYRVLILQVALIPRFMFKIFLTPMPN